MVLSSVNVEVAAFGSPPLIILMVSVDVKQHLKKCSTPAKLVVVWVWV